MRDPVVNQGVGVGHAGGGDAENLLASPGVGGWSRWRRGLGASEAGDRNGPHAREAGGPRPAHRRAGRRPFGVVEGSADEENRGTW